MKAPKGLPKLTVEQAVYIMRMRGSREYKQLVAAFFRILRLFLQERLGEAPGIADEGEKKI